MVLAGALAACVGDDPPLSVSGAPDAGPAGDGGGVPALAPDAAPPLGCPLGCLPPAPAGWTGPSAVFNGKTGDLPAACPTLYSNKEVEARQEMTADPAVCTCAAPTEGAATCTVTLAMYTSPSSCNSAMAAIAAVGVAPGASACIPRDQTYSHATLASVALSGSCTFATTKTLPPPVFGRSTVACGLPQVGACSARPECTATPTPEEPYGRLCIHKDGDESCPSFDYAARFVAHRSTNDGRDCAACTGTTACGTTFSLSIDSCATKVPPSLPGTLCTALNGDAVDVRGLGPVCTAVQGTSPKGTVTSIDPITFCCNR